MVLPCSWTNLSLFTARKLTLTPNGLREKSLTVYIFNIYIKQESTLDVTNNMKESFLYNLQAKICSYFTLILKYWLFNSVMVEIFLVNMV